MKQNQTADHSKDFKISTPGPRSLWSRFLIKTKTGVLPAHMIAVHLSYRQGQKCSVSFLLPGRWMLMNSRLLKSKFFLSCKKIFSQGLLDRYKRFRQESKPIDCVCLRIKWRKDKTQGESLTTPCSKISIN